MANGGAASSSSSSRQTTMAPASTSASAQRQPAVDVAVVGAGIVGSALAYALARSGRSVALLERDLSEPDRIVGELLQPGGVRALQLLGMRDCLEGIDAVPVEGYHVFYGEQSVPIPYPDQGAIPATSAQEAKVEAAASKSGRIEGRSFHHGRFIQKLRERAMAQEGVTTYEATVRELVEDRSGRVRGVAATRKRKQEGQNGSAASSDEELYIEAAVTIVADGCFSKFRRTYGSTIAPKVRSNFVGLELNHAPLPSPHHGHVVLGPAGPTLLYQISSEHTRILMDIPGEKLPSVGKGELQRYIVDRVLPQLPPVLQPCVLKEVESGQRLRSMPNSFLPPSMQGQNKHRQGVILVGDAMNMRHPLTGGGMSVGLWDVVHLTSELGGSKWRPHQDEQKDASKESASLSPTRDLQDWDSLRPGLRAWHWKRKGLASVINILAQALYSLFGADDANLEVLREGCFKYFELGGECVGGPVSLLSGLAPRPLLLVYHFFSVAIYSIYILFAHPRPVPGQVDAQGHAVMRKPSIVHYPALFLRSIAVFYTACVVLLPVVFTELRSNVPAFTAASISSSKESSAREGSNGRSVAVTTEKAEHVLSSINTTYIAVALAAVAAFVYSGQASRPSSFSGLSEIVLPSRFT